MATIEIPPAGPHATEPQLPSGVSTQALLYEQALGHEARVPHLVRLPLDEETYPSQNIDTRYVDGSPIPIADMHNFVVDIEKRFPAVPKRLAEVEAETGLLTSAGKHMQAGGNVIIVCEHEQVTDLGCLSIGYSEVLQEIGFSPKASIIAGKIIPYLGYEVRGHAIPLIDIMKMGGERIYLSYPPETESTVNSGIPAREIRKNNVAMGKQLAADLDEGGWLVAMDPLGTTLKIVDGKAVFAVDGMSRGTLGILMHPKTKVIANGLLMSGEDIVFETDKTMRSITGPSDLQAALDAEADMLNRNCEDVEFVSPPLPEKLFGKALGKTAVGN